MQDLVDARIKEDGVEMVSKWLKMFYNHEYTKERSKYVLKQITVESDYI